MKSEVKKEVAKPKAKTVTKKSEEKKPRVLRGVDEALFKKGFKVCNKCGKKQKLEEFTNNKKRVDGKNRKCKSCNKEARLRRIEKKKKATK